MSLDYCPIFYEVGAIIWRVEVMSVAGIIAVSSPEGLQFAKEHNFSTVVKDKRFSGCDFAATARKLGLKPIELSPRRNVLCVLNE